MPDDPQSPPGDRDARRSGSQGPLRPARKKRYLLLILLAVPACFVVLCCGGIPAYLAFGVKNTSDPVEILAALESMTDVDLPPELEPHTKSSQITGVESVEFRSVSGQSYLMMGTGSRFRLQHASTLREDYDRGRVAGGGQPESPAEERTIKATVRGQPAEFIYRRYLLNETVSGYFQGKQYPVEFQAQLDLGEFEPGTAAAIAESIH